MPHSTRRRGQRAPREMRAHGVGVLVEERCYLENMESSASPRDDAAERLRYAKVLTEVGHLLEAEHEIGAVLQEHPDDEDALSLVVKIKHMRGELSLALAGWATLHTRKASATPSARLRLAALLHLAQQSRPGHQASGPYLAELAPAQVVRKPVPYLELERAFCAFLTNRPQEARARARLVALHSRATDRELYKLAVLAESFMAEHAGDLLDACRLLEQLGAERAFAADLDRVIPLASLYERIGSPEKLRAATHIYRFLAQEKDGLVAFRHLADLYKKLGDDEAAARAEREHALAFYARLMRPTVHDVITIASRRYLPLSLVTGVRLVEDGREREPGSARARALLSAMSGRLEEARRGFEESAGLLDQKYLADVDRLAGDTEAALARALAAAREDPEDLWLSFRLLDLTQEQPTEPLLAHFRDARHAEPARAALTSRVLADPLDPVPWRRLALLDELSASVSLEARQRAQTLARGQDSRRHAIGRALAASVYAFPSGAREGLIHEVWAGKEIAPAGRGGGTLPDENIFGNLTPEMRRTIKSTFLAVLEYARAKLPHRATRLFEHRYTYKVTKEDEPSGGASAGLPTALAFLSVFTDTRLPQDFASTGQIVADAHDVLTVHPVGDVPYKVRAVCHRNLRTLLAPRGNEAELLASPLVPRAVSVEMTRFVSTLDEAVREVWGEDFFA